MNKVQFSLHTALTAWQWGPFSICVTVALVAIGYGYLRADWSLAGRGRRWPGRRTAAFLAGLVAVDLALQSPVATFTGSYFQAHVTQHLLLMVVAPPLLALGAPSTLLLQTASRANKKRWLAVLRSRPFAVASHPVLVWFFYFGAMFAFFLSPLLNFAMGHMAVMDVINLTFLLGGTFYWWPMVGLDPIVHWKMGFGARIANLALGVPFEAFLGIAIMSQRAPIASMYTVASTRAGGALLWAATEVATFAGMVPIFLQWMRADDRAGRRADARAPRAPAPARADLGPAELALAGDASVTTSLLGERARPLFQPGNASWEAMWRAKAGYVPSSRAEAPGRPARGQDGEPEPPEA
jgi:putative copper resistance protein D